MKKPVYLSLCLVWISSMGHAQNNVHSKLVIPLLSPGIYLHQKENLNAALFSFNLNNMAESENSSRSLFADLPLVKLREFNCRKNTSLSAAFSLNDMLESMVNSIQANLLNTYDDQIAELFKEAPSLVKLKCIIRL